MKTINNIKKIAVATILPLFMIFFVVSCGNDDDATGRNFDIAELEARIAVAENLIATAVEGINAGDYQPGSKDDLQDVVNWIYKRIESSSSQANIDDAVVKINAAIDKFLLSTVAVANPWVQHGVGSGIELSNNVKLAIYEASTIEVEIYIADLNQAGFSNNLFSTEDEPSRGLAARYFGTGEIQIVAGTVDGWPESPRSPAGTLKSGEWMNVAFTNSGTEQHLYINGELVASNTAVPEQTDVPWILGNSPTFNDRSSNVVFKEFKLWDSVFDQTTIQGNIGQNTEGTESGLVAYFPLGSNLGSSFSDVVGNSTATLQGNVEWVAEPPVIIKDFSALQAAIDTMKDYRDNTVSEGTQDGDHPVGTTDYINELLANAEALLTSDPAQGTIDDTAQSLLDAIDGISNNLVADANGVTKQENSADFDLFRITPAYTPSGDYTIEFEMQFKSLLGFVETDIYNNNHYIMRVTGVADPTDENSFFSSGRIQAYSFDGTDWQLAESPPLTVVPSDDFYHIALVYDATADIGRVYVNGEMVAEKSGFGLPNGWAAPEIDFFRGQDLLGSLKNLRYWDVARSPGELNADIIGDEADLRMYFPLDRVSGVRFMDATGVYTTNLWNNVKWNTNQ